MKPPKNATPTEPDAKEMVELSDGGRVPRRFWMGLRSGPDAAGWVSLIVEMRGTRPKIAEVLGIEPARSNPLDVEDLNNIDWAALVRTAVQVKVVQCSGYVLDEESDYPYHERNKRAARVADRSLRRNAVTKSDLVELVALVEEVGVVGAVKKTGKSRGYIYKLLQRAREELQ
jgi:hypothetical protein